MTYNIKEMTVAEMDSTGKYEMKLLKVKHKVTETNIVVDGFISRFNTDDERINELEEKPK